MHINVRSILNKKVLAGAGIVLSIATSGFGGYTFAKKTLEKEYAARSEKEIAEAKEFYSRLYKKDGYATPEEAAAILIPETDEEDEDMSHVAEMLRQYGGERQPEPKAEQKNIFIEQVVKETTTTVEVATDDPEDNPEDEDSEDDDEHDPDRPYIISQEEFFENESGYEQVSLTYYNEDDVLADEADKPIEDTDAVVGDINLPRFGHKSKDPNLLYIRNEKLETEFEIAQSHGSFTTEVLGFIQHSDRRPGIRRFRGDDE